MKLLAVLCMLSGVSAVWQIGQQRTKHRNNKETEDRTSANSQRLPQMTSSLLPQMTSSLLPQRTSSLQATLSSKKKFFSSTGEDPTYFKGNPHLCDNGVRLDSMPTVEGQQVWFGECTVTLVKLVKKIEDGKSETTGFDFNSTCTLDKINVKAGNGGHRYTYIPPTLSSTGLITPWNKGISHLDFCFNDTTPVAKPTLNPTVSPTVSPATTNPTMATQNPTNNPTLNPTVSPTTTHPTPGPSSSPTLNPTQSPTTVSPLTVNPTHFFATSNPTKSPAIATAQSPTKSPTAFVDPVDYDFCKDTILCQIRGDPHFVTFDDNAFSLMKKGEHLLTASHASGISATGCLTSFVVQDISYLTKVAFRCGPSSIAYMDAAQPGTVELYGLNTDTGAWEAQSDWSQSPISTWPVRKNQLVVACPTLTRRALGSRLHLQYRSVREAKNKANLVQVLNLMIYLDRSSSYGNVTGLCNAYPPDPIGTFKGRNGTAHRYPTTRKEKRAFVSHTDGPSSWATDTTDQMFSLIGKECPTEEGVGLVDVNLGGVEENNKATNDPYAACMGDEAAITAVKTCVQGCHACHGVDKRSVDECVFDILAECDPDCRDAYTENPCHSPQ